MAAAVLIAATAVVAGTDDKWASVSEGADAWAALGYGTHFVINIGDVKGTDLVHNVGTTTMKTMMPGASTSKWPTAALMSNLVKEGYMNFSDKANKYIDWWAKDPSDSRSAVTLEQMLSFTDGYTSMAFARCASNATADFMSCVREVYEKTPHTYAAGSVWKYGSEHYQFAGAMAVAATGIPIDELYHRFLLKPLGMNNTYWGTPKNPLLAAGMHGCGEDYEKFLHALLTKSFLGPITDVLERDWAAPPVTMLGPENFLGHYGMGNFFLCYGYRTGLPNASQPAPQPLPDRCLKQQIHADPGLWGWYPYIDRRREFYYQLVVKESWFMATVPEFLVMLHRPLINQILDGVDPKMVNRRDLMPDGALMIRDFGTVHYSIKMGKLTPPATRPAENKEENDAAADGFSTIMGPIRAWGDFNYTTNFRFQVGGGKSRLDLPVGHFPDVQYPAGTAGAWPASVAIAAVVAEGKLSFDDLASKHLTWWTTEAADLRSKITLRHLLSMTSGFKDMANVECASNPTADFASCARDLYNAMPVPTTAPGAAWFDSAANLQFAGAMAVAASRRSIVQLLGDAVLQKAGMHKTEWAGGSNPVLATGMLTTADDYGLFLDAVLNYALLPKEVAAEVEKDQTAAANPAGDGWTGHYAMGNWVECIEYAVPGGPGAKLLPMCEEQDLRAVQGSLGWYAVVDRKNGYWMQIATHEEPKRARLPAYLRLLTKYAVDVVVAGEDLNNVNRINFLTANSALLLHDLVYIARVR